MSKDKELQAELIKIDADINQINRALDKLSAKKQKLLSRKQEIKQKIQESETEKLASQNWERSDHPWSEKVNETLQSVFKMNKFRPHQLSTINAVMSNHDCILLMPTGGGKSLCYQMPAMVLPGITLVVSPLVSLMEDQIMAMEALKVPAVLLNASSTREHVNHVQKQMLEKKPSIKLIYVTPEKLAKSKRFMAKLEKMYKLGNFSLLAIDEVHCCSQWGHDFRTDYKFLGIMKRQFPKVPILGLTATATSSVITDVQNILNIQGCLVLRASFNRPNLKYEVVCKSSCQKDNVNELENMLKNRFNGLTGIIYCFSIKDSEEIASELRKRSIKARAYHAQLDAKSRSAVHHSWSSGSIHVIVATVAFGMGIDKPDVRFVIHHSMPKSMENFYQESGRAGRDDQPASCILFYRFPDIFRQSTMIFTDQKGLEHLYAMVSYCLDLSRCRRSIIADHFGERWESSDCNNMCDHCEHFSPYVGKTKDVSKQYKTLCCILEHCNGLEERVTAQKLIDLWQGKGTPKLRPPQYEKTPLSRENCERIVALLLLDSYLVEEFHFTPYSTISYINVGPRNLPHNGELLLPLPVLRAKVESKTLATPKCKVNTNTVKNTPLKTPDSPVKKKQKISSETNIEKSSYSNHCSGPATKKLSSFRKDKELYVINKLKSRFHKPEEQLIKNEETTEHIKPEPIELSDNELDFEAYDIISNPKEKKSVVVKPEEQLIKNEETTEHIKPEPIELSDTELDFGAYDIIRIPKKKKSAPIIVVSDSE